MPPLVGAQNERSPANVKIHESIFGPAQIVKYTAMMNTNANGGIA